MYCVKCGRDIQESAVFCADCLEDGKRYPIKPDTAIHLPQRPVAPEKYSPRRRKELTATEQLVHLRISIRRLRNAVLILSLCLCLAVALMVLLALEPALIPIPG